jgi:hypothetical protein
VPKKWLPSADDHTDGPAGCQHEDVEACKGTRDATAIVAHGLAKKETRASGVERYYVHNSAQEGLWSGASASPRQELNSRHT